MGRIMADVDSQANPLRQEKGTRFNSSTQRVLEVDTQLYVTVDRGSTTCGAAARGCVAFAECSKSAEPQ